MDKKITTFEAALGRLEEIAGVLESGKCTLQQTAALAKEAAELTAFCNKQLTEFESTVKILEQEISDTEVKWKDFQTSEEE